VSIGREWRIVGAHLVAGERMAGIDAHDAADRDDRAPFRKRLPDVDQPSLGLHAVLGGEQAVSDRDARESGFELGSESEAATHLAIAEALAWVEGVYATPDGRPLLAPESDRAAIFGNVVRAGYESGETPDWSLLTWELAYVHMLLESTGEHPECGDLLARNREGWAGVLVPEGEGFATLDPLDAVWLVTRTWFGVRRGAPRPERDDPGLVAAERALVAALDAEAGWKTGSAAGDLAGRALRNLYQKHLWNDPARLRALGDRLAERRFR